MDKKIAHTKAGQNVHVNFNDTSTENQQSIVLMALRDSPKQGVLEALKHNKRELQSERGAGANIDVTRTPLNYALAGQDTPANIALHAKVQMLMAGIETPRKNAVMAVEIIFSLPIDRQQQNTKPFFADCHAWVLKTFAGELLSFDVHLDEAAPHAHAIILPLIDNNMQGNYT